MFSVKIIEKKKPKELLKGQKFNDTSHCMWGIIIVIVIGIVIGIGDNNTKW